MKSSQDPEQGYWKKSSMAWKIFCNMLSDERQFLNHHLLWDQTTVQKYIYIDIEIKYT